MSLPNYTFRGYEITRPDEAGNYVVTDFAGAVVDTFEKFDDAMAHIGTLPALNKTQGE